MQIEVRNKLTYNKGTFAGGEVIKTIKRKPFHKGFVGNFVPHWVRYMCKLYQLQGGWDYAYMHGEPDEAFIEV